MILHIKETKHAMLIWLSLPFSLPPLHVYVPYLTFSAHHTSIHAFTQIYGKLPLHFDCIRGRSHERKFKLFLRQRL